MRPRGSEKQGSDHAPRWTRTLPSYKVRLLARIRRMMGPEARENFESSDVLQSVYAETIRRLREGNLAGEKLLPWMTEVAHHKIVDQVRRRREQPLDGVSGVLASGGRFSLVSRLSDEEARKGLAEALVGLDPVRRRVVALRCEEGWSWERIAVDLGRSEEAVRKLYHRTLLELGESLSLRKVGAESAITA